MGKPTICMCENKGADQLRSNCEADQRLCFRYTDSTVPHLLKSKISIFCDCAAWFVLDLVRNPNCWFSHAQDHNGLNQMEVYDKVLGFVRELYMTEILLNECKDDIIRGAT